MGDHAEDPFPHEEGVPAEEEEGVQVLDQQSRALNVYNAAGTATGRMSINSDDKLVIAYKYGLGEVHFPGPLSYVHAGASYPLGESIYQIGVRIDDEITARGTAVSDEAVRAKGIEADLRTDLTTETNERKAAVTAVTDSLAKKDQDQTTARTALKNSVEPRLDTLESVDTAQATAIAENVSAISSEASRALAAELVLRNNLASEVANRQTAIADEAKSRAADKTELESKISDERTRAEDAEGVIDGKVTTEKTRAESAEAALGARIDSILSNVDQTAIDSFTEVLAKLGENDGAQAASLSSSISAVETTAADLQVQINILRATLLNLQWND